MAKRRPPSELTPYELRERMIREGRRIVGDCEQAIRDAEYWNSINPNETPMDVEDFRIHRAQVLSVLRQLEAL